MIRKAFLPGAGLGTRLRPLTDRLPKPLVPLFHRPLIAWALDACRAAGIDDVAINTHHLPDRWTQPEGGLDLTGLHETAPGANGVPSVIGTTGGQSLRLFHEPLLLETGGGVKNVADWADGQPVLVHNGDIFSSLPLDRLIAAHEASGLPVTLALRSHGVATHIAIDGDRVTDIHSKLGRAKGTHVFSGIYCFSPELLDLIPPGEPVSVIPAFLKLAETGRLGHVVLDEGSWYDLGDPAAYLAAHRDLALAPPIHGQAVVAADATVERSVVGPGAVIGAGAVVRDSVIWPGARVEAGASVDGAIVTH